MRLLLIEPNPTDATSFYRSRGVWPFIKDVTIQIPRRWDKLEWTEAVLCDVAVVQRPSHPHSVHTIGLLKECGKKVIVDYDDDVTCIEDHNPVFEHFSKNIDDIIKCMEMADVVTVSTQALYDSFSKYNKRVVIIPNALNDFIFPVNHKSPFRFRHIAYYRGGSTHQRDVYARQEEIVRMIKQNPYWKFFFIGDRFQFIEAQTQRCKNHFAINYLPCFEFLKMINELAPTVHFNFLQDTPFNRAKSNCAWIEATYAGAASLAPLGLPEFVNKPAIQYSQVDKSFAAHVTVEGKYGLRDSHNASWDYIQSNLLLSQVNLQRLAVLNDN